MILIAKLLFVYKLSFVSKPNYYRTNADENILVVIKKMRNRLKNYKKAITYLQKHKIWQPQLDELSKKERTIDRFLNSWRNNRYNPNVELPEDLTLWDVFGYTQR